MKIGMVLEGGAMRGMYTAGVLDVFMEHKIKIDKIVGVSAGALFGVNYYSGQTGRVIRYNKRFNQDKNYLGIRPLCKEGNLVSTKYAYDTVPKHLDPFYDDAFKASPGKFYAVVTNVKNGHAEYMEVKSVFDQMDLLRASGSMPLVSKAVPLHNQLYLDGGISDSIPYRWMAKQDVDKIIVVLTQDASYIKKKMSPFLVGLNAIKYPAIARRLRQRHEEYNHSVRELMQWEAEGKAFVIRPSKALTIHKIERDPQKLEAVYQLGKQDAQSIIHSLYEYLQ